MKTALILLISLSHICAFAQSYRGNYSPITKWPQSLLNCQNLKKIVIYDSSSKSDVEKTLKKRGVIVERKKYS